MHRERSRHHVFGTADRIWHLQQAGLLEGLSPADFNAVASVCEDRVYAKNEIIFDSDEPAQSLFILNRGCVRVSLSDGEGREKIVAICSPGDVFGEDVLGPEECFHSRAAAHEESWVSIISRSQFLDLIRQRTSIALNCIRILNGKLLDAREDLGAKTFLNTERRLGQTLVKLAEAHGKPVLTDREIRKIKIVVSHEDLARLLGGNRPHVSSVMSRFKKQGWIDYEGRKLLVNVAQLERLGSHNGRNDQAA